MGGFVRCEFVADRVPAGRVDRAAGRRRARVRRRALSRRHRPDARARLRALIGATTVRRMGAELLFVTQVAPYRDGPAGVHGVLDQAAVGVAQIAELHGLHRDASTTCARSEPEVAGERACPRAVHDRRDAVERSSSAARSSTAFAPVGLAVVLDPLGDRLVLRLGRVRRARRRPVRRPPVDADVRRRRARPDASRLRASRRGVAAGTTRCTSSAICAPTRRCCSASATASSTSTAAGARPPAFGYPLAWCFAEGAGRVFSTSLGHFPAAWESPAYLRHLAGGLGWALGDVVTRARNFSELGVLAAAARHDRRVDPCPLDDPAEFERVAGAHATHACSTLLGPDPDPVPLDVEIDRVGRLRHVPPRPRRLRHRSDDVGARVPARAARARREPGPPCSRSTGTDRASRCVCGVVDGRRGRRLRAPARGAGLRRARARPPRLRRTRRLDARRQVPLRLEPRVRDDGRRRAARAQPLGPAAVRSTCSPRTRSSTPTASAVAGLSYGGTCTLFLAALDDRVRAAVVSGYLVVVARRAHRAVEHVRLAGAAGSARRARAPRRRRVGRAASAARRDRAPRIPSFPAAAARRTVASLAVLYEQAGVPHALVHDVFAGDHRWHGAEVEAFLERTIGK